MPIRSQFLRSKIWLFLFLFWIASKIRRWRRSQESSDIFPTQSLAVDDTKLCDLYVPSKFSSAQHLLDTIAPADLPFLLGSVSFWWIAAFLLWLRKAYYEVTASIMQGEDVESKLLMKTQAIEWRYLCRIVRISIETYNAYSREPILAPPVSAYPISTPPTISISIPSPILNTSFVFWIFHFWLLSF